MTRLHQLVCCGLSLKRMDKRIPCSLRLTHGKTMRRWLHWKRFLSLADGSVVFNHHASMAAAIFIPSSLFMSLKNWIEAPVFADVMQHKLCKPCKASSMCALNSKGLVHPLMSSVLFFIKLNSFTSTAAQHYQTGIILSILWQKKTSSVIMVSSETDFHCDTISVFTTRLH